MLLNAGRKDVDGNLSTEQKWQGCGYTFDIGVGCEYTIVKGVGCGNTIVKGIGCGNTMVNDNFVDRQ